MRLPNMRLQRTPLRGAADTETLAMHGPPKKSEMAGVLLWYGGTSFVSLLQCVVLFPKKAALGEALQAFFFWPLIMGGQFFGLATGCLSAIALGVIFRRTVLVRLLGCLGIMVWFLYGLIAAYFVAP